MPRDNLEPSARFRDALLETPEDHLGRFNLACTRIALVMLAGIAAITLVAEISR